MDPIIELRDVFRIYRARGADVVALRGVDMVLKKGDFVVITGPSGSGKTTLLNIVGGIDRPTAGKVYFNGTDIFSLDERKIAEYRRNATGYVFQLFNLVSFLTVRQNVVLSMYLDGNSSQSRCKERAVELLELVGLSDRADAYPALLSGGEQQRAAIAAALCNSPSVILADEPTAELDTYNGNTVLELFQRLNRDEGRTVLIVTHDDRVARLAKRSFQMDSGKLSTELST